MVYSLCQVDTLTHHLPIEPRYVQTTYPTVYSAVDIIIDSPKYASIPHALHMSLFKTVQKPRYHNTHIIFHHTAIHYCYSPVLFILKWYSIRTLKDTRGTNLTSPSLRLFTVLRKTPKLRRWLDLKYVLNICWFALESTILLLKIHFDKL